MAQRAVLLCAIAPPLRLCVKPLRHNFSNRVFFSNFCTHFRALAGSLGTCKSRPVLCLCGHKLKINLWLRALPMDFEK